MKTVRLKDLIGIHTLSAVEPGYAGGSAMKPLVLSLVLILAACCPTSLADIWGEPLIQEYPWERPKNAGVEA